MSLFHFLLTRFNLRNDAQLCAPDDEWLRARAAVFARYTAPSVREQVERNFSWLIFCDVESPDWLLAFLAQEAAKAEVVLLREFAPDAVADAVSRRIGAADARVITTRLDNDDAIGRDFTAVVQREASRCPTVSALNVVKGCQLAGEKLYLRSDPSNAFISLVEDVDGLPLRGVFDLQHQEWIDSVPTRQIVTKPMWLQVIHGRNLANRPSGIPAKPSTVQKQFPFALPPDPSAVDLTRRRLVSGVRLGARVVGSPHRIVWLARVARAAMNSGRKEAA